ncbi:MAG: class I glutamine amidotransferase-like protein [Benniella sp.]|nr:MAG: class I glutamine amidotransferase-like protein [Benniella sp.]
MVSTDKPSIRVALLVCDIPIAPVATAHGKYPDMFKDLLLLGLEHLKQESAIAQDTELIMGDFDVREFNYPENLGEWDAVLITGSASNAYDDIPWINQLVEYVKEIPRDQKAPKVVGICFGHQIIGRAYNAKVGKNVNGWELGWTNTELTEAGQEFWQDTHMRIQELHQDIVYDLPEGFTLLASTEHTANQSMISNDHQIVSVQGHPEFTGEIMKKYIEIRTANGTFSKELSEASSKLVDEPLDRAKIAGRILQFAATKA